MLRALLLLLRWLVPVAWLVTAGVTVWMFVRILSLVRPDGHHVKLDVLAVAAGFIALAIWSLRTAYKEYREARNAPPLPPPTRHKPMPLAQERYPLAAPLRAELLRTIELMEAAGMLEAGEVSPDEIVACAEQVDAFEEMDIVMVANVLRALREERGVPFDHLAFFADQVETTEDDALDMVRELARVSGQSESVRGLRFRMTGAVARRGEFPPPNAVVEFQLGAQPHVVPFVMYGKNAPGGLTEGLAQIFTRPDDPRRFFEAGFDSFAIVTFSVPAKIAELNSAMGPDLTWMQVRGAI